jgi:hypothetical protein
LAGAVPTAADDVFFDNLSNATLYTCTLTTLPVCRSLSISGPATGNVTIAGSGLAISGSLAIASTGVTRTYTGAITFNATTTGWTISAGVSLAGITFNGLGGGWTLTAALTGGNVIITAGAFNTAGFALTMNELHTSAGSLVRSLSLGASVVNLSGSYPIDFGGGTFTFNAGTSTININFGGTPTSFGGYTFYNVNFTSTILVAYTFNQATTFQDLSFASKSAIGVIRITLAGNLTVNGTLTFPAPTTLGSSRYFVKSDVYGTTRTLTAATVNLTDVDFQDITGAGAASWVGTRLGNAGGNSNITFDTPKTVYWNLVTGGVITGLGWALSSGGTPSRDNFPLPQDTMTFVDTGLNASASITLGSAYNFGGIDCSARTLAMTLATVTTTLYGSIALSSSVTMSGTAVLTFQNRGAITITSAGRTFTQAITFNGIGGTYTLAGDLTVNGAVILTYGTLSLVTYTFTCLTFNASGTLTRALTMGSGGFVLTSTGTVWNLATATGMTLTAGTSTITLSNTTTTARTFAGGGLTYNNLVIGGATGISTLTFTGSNTFNTISSTKTVAHTILFTAGTTTTVSDWTVTGTAGNVVTIGSATAASHNLVKTGGGNISVDYMSISRSNAS